MAGLLWRGEALGREASLRTLTEPRDPIRCGKDLPPALAVFHVVPGCGVMAVAGAPLSEQRLIAVVNATKARTRPGTGCIA